MGRAVVVWALLAGCGRWNFDPLTPPECIDPGDALGMGTLDDPFRVCTAEQLIALTDVSANLDARYLLVDDLDFAGVSFAGIGGNGVAFSGVLDGADHVIANATVAGGAGEPSGFFNVVAGGRIENVELANLVVTGVEKVGGLVGACDAGGQVRNATLSALDVRGSVDVGGLFGFASNCNVVGLTSSGTVRGDGEGIGGVVGSTGESTYFSIDTAVAVDAPLATGVGGVIGIEGFADTYVSHVVVQADVVGDSQVGGIQGEAGDGTSVYRTTFTGSVRGNTNVGGMLGQIDDWPYTVRSTAVNAEVYGTSNVGGFVGSYFYRGDIADSHVRGTLHGVGAGQSRFGGFYGWVEYYGLASRSYVDLTIDSTASNVGGFVGELGYADPDTARWDISSSFSATNITGSSPTATLSRWVGLQTQSDILPGTGSSYLGSSTCTNLGGGGCGGGGASATLAQLQDASSAQLAGWDFSRVWQAQAGGFPTLRTAQSSVPSATHDCPATAISDFYYACPITVVDDDVNELQVAILDRTHTCTWLYPEHLDLIGHPSIADATTCTVAFRVVDGVNEGPLETFTVEVHAGVVMTPTTNAAVYSFGSVTTGSTVAQTFTLTNREPDTVTGLAVTGLPANTYAFRGGSYPGTGGTCGTTLASQGTCTMVIEFRPTAVGSLMTPISIQFTNARGPVMITYTLSGTGA